MKPADCGCPTDDEFVYHAAGCRDRRHARERPRYSIWPIIVGCAIGAFFGNLAGAMLVAVVREVLR